MKVAAANRLTDGEAVWLSRNGVWTDTLQAAEVANDKQAEAEVERIAKAAVAANEVVDLELIDVEVVDGLIVPVRLRERIKAAGPTIRPDLGKQARTAAA
jgi:hypothetical protein